MKRLIFLALAMACVLGCGGEREKAALLRAEMPLPQDRVASLQPDILRNNDDELAKRSSLAEEYWETFFEREALDSVVVSRTDYRSAQRDLHPDTVFEELEGMFERGTPLGLFLRYWGVVCSALVLLAVFIWLARALVCSVRWMGKRCLPSRSDAQNKRVTQSRVSVQTPAEEEKEVAPYGEYDVFEKVGYVLPVKPHMTKVTCFLMPQRTRCALMVPLEADRTALPTYGRDSTSVGLRRQRGIQTN